MGINVNLLYISITFPEYGDFQNANNRALIQTEWIFSFGKM